MAKGRMVAKSICTSKKVNQLTPIEENFYIRLITKCDDHGCFFGEVDMLLAEIFPRKRDMSEQQIKEIRDKVCEVGLAVLYKENDELYISVKQWGDHQRLRNTKGEFPQPTKENIILPQSAASCGKPRQSAARTELELELELNGTEDELELPNEHEEINKNQENDETPKISQSSSENVFQVYQNEIGPLGSMISQNINVWIDDLAEDVIIKAIRIAVENNKRNWGYIEGTLRNWYNAGLKDLANIEAHEKEFQRNKRGEDNAKPSGHSTENRGASDSVIGEQVGRIRRKKDL